MEKLNLCTISTPIENPIKHPNSKADIQTIFIRFTLRFCFFLKNILPLVFVLRFDCSIKNCIQSIYLEKAKKGVFNRAFFIFFKKSKDNKKETEGSASEEQATGLYL
ncbi:hypothetical protein Q0O85_05645 [Priestia megaterium]|uniref:hypothetical protein n=1 Tax=Priestia megaterium TaxID=1404 RepID=UPI0034576106